MSRPLRIHHIQVSCYKMIETKEEDYAQFIQTQPPSTIAACLRRDQLLCQEKHLPSPLAMHLPTQPCELLDAISQHLIPDSSIPAPLRRLQCQGIISGIKASVNQMNSITTWTSPTTEKGTGLIPRTQDFQSALRVLEYLQKYPSISQLSNSSPLTDVLSSVKTQLAFEDGLRAVNHLHMAHKDSRVDSKASYKARRRKGNCYMCHFEIRDGEAHDTYPSLCRPCGSFNLAESALSQPPNLNLKGKTALVTGGRINLGYETALRLLRCGASVIVSSRYPRDAVLRYAREVDFGGFSARLKVVGADFRTARDAFRLVEVVKRVLDDWAGDGTALDILINNAAQTLTDPVRSETRAIVREEKLEEEAGAHGLIADDGGAIAGSAESECVEDSGIVQKGLGPGEDESRSSWTQSLDQIPYEDVISAQAVNAFVPLILCRELLPRMGATSKSSRPLGYIVNVSSREGILESRTKSASKAGHHVHTNMSKAALNMITETESESAWKRHVAMNTVDPGYMSAAPECQRADGCPIGFEDGAARVLWPIAIGEREHRVICGRFMKHFGHHDAIISRGI
ncbi:putative short-chain dehydrogenase [Aspergillus nomiae NRRL 13137]|uniref:Putative short-chain dehydrogenase n=1 Tax=Aspergillus nomiae NRRL (strain ATCC 15546 / NRRL 13137 / CBS 260.88 / M93) TaxID=1509407 RepID=A0A0L1IVB3_ASPN3|nr:putative short-chain dehydrogenase [Aspergillus nomiae NRRL 13137]KNG83365.1 putative short-chain dehydrogenase [Aspergillus nomiae NRRL 13137]